MTKQSRNQNMRPVRSALRLAPERPGMADAADRPQLRPRSEGVRPIRSVVTHVWRPVLACAVAVPFALGAMAGVSGAGTVGAAAAGPPTGSYSGSESQNGNGMSFYVSANQKSLQDVTFPLVALNCSPGNSWTNDHISVASVTLGSTGSFATTTKQTGVVLGFPAKFVYMFKGSLHGTSASGAPMATGTYSEKITYTDSVARTCTSKVQTWSAARDTQPAQPTTAPPTGSYSGNESQNGNGLSFYVSADQKRLQDVTFPLVGLNCAPGNTWINDHISVASVALTADGSFTSTTTQTGVIFGLPATYTYSFRGNFHGVNAAGVPRAAGTFTETTAYTDSTARSCTTDSQWWSAARSTQPTQPTTAPPTGSYSGNESQNGNGMSFNVSSDQKSLQNVIFPLVGLNCSPGNTWITDHFSVASVALNPDGSFTSTTTQTGVVSGLSATFTYSFRGNFHGVDASGAERAAGTFAETITYTDSTTRSCTTDSQWWYASLK